MKNEKLCAARIIPCELLDVRPSALDYATQDITHQLTDSVMCELEKGELICSLGNVEQHQLHDLNSVKIIRKVRIKRLVRCKDCKYRYDSLLCRMYSEGMETVDDWFCADGERKEGR